jgi:UDP-glucuronate decarboxylase
MTAFDAESIVESDLRFICERAGGDFRQMEGQSVLVTGGGGFLGQYLVRSLLAWNQVGGGEPISVVLADNWIRGEPSWLAAHRADPNLEVVTLDITRPWPSELALGNWVLHAASIASPTFYRRHPIATMDANVGGLRRLLDQATTQRGRDELQGLLFFSSSEVYGDPPPEAIPTAETYNGNVSFTGPRACYDESKRYGETLCVNFSAIHGVPVSAVRPFNNYGPGLPITDRRVICDFAQDICADRDVMMLSAGTPTRTFCYVADAVAGYFATLVRGRRGEAYNIGSDAPEISMRELAERMVAIADTEFGYSGTVATATSEEAAYLVDNPNRRCPDITKARIELGFEPRIGLEEGLGRALHWYRATSALSGVC